MVTGSSAFCPDQQGAQETRATPPPPRKVSGYEMLFEIREIKEHKHMHTQPYTQKSGDTEKCLASVVNI